MKQILGPILAAAVSVSSASGVLAQAFGEYGRAVGSVPHGRGITGSGPSGRSGSGQGNIYGGVGDLGGRSIPARLIVVRKDAGLFPRQDEESQKIAQLTEGEKLVPMLQTEGGGQWFMVKTEKGLVGWVKSNDVRSDKTQK